jgi:hypothetical protein
MRHLPLGAAIAIGSLTAQGPFPLPASAGNTTPIEDSAPFVIPLRMTQTRIVDRDTLIAAGMPDQFSQFDMIAFDPGSRWVFITAEQTDGAGLFRWDRQTQTVRSLIVGDESGSRDSTPSGWSASNDDFSNLDPCLWTPWGTVLCGEEAQGGRVFEIMNPLSPNGPWQVVWRSKFAAVYHEGMRIDAQGNVYYSDEDHSGSFYKFVPSTPGNLSTGQTFVLSVDAFAASSTTRADRNWDSSVNRTVSRFGPATWVPLTNASGTPLTSTNPFAFVNAESGKAAADELKATPFGRAEDMDIGVLANGHQVLYSSLTGEHRVISIELISATTAHVREFVNFDTINLATGTDVNPQQNDPYTAPGPGTVFNAPDNLAVDAWGDVYIIEDSMPGDLWKAVDQDRDGVAEAIGLFASLGVANAEPAGIVFDPNDPYRCFVNILGPSSGNSALWSFDTRPYDGSDADLRLLTGVNGGARTGPVEFVKEVAGDDHAVLRVESPDHTLDQVPFAVLIQAFRTDLGTVSVLPDIWINPAASYLAVVGATGALLPTAGSTTNVYVPTGLLGWSVMVQGIAVHNGAFVLTDGHEYVLH